MTAVVDTSALVDHLRGVEAATAVLLEHRAGGLLWASEITRLEVLAGAPPTEQDRTSALLRSLTWRTVDTEVAQLAGALGRRWLPSHPGIDAADLAIAATAELVGGVLLTLDVRRFPMVAGLTRPYWPTRRQRPPDPGSRRAARGCRGPVSCGCG